MLVPTKIVRRCTLHGCRLADVLERRAGMCDGLVLVLHLPAEAIGIGYVVEVDIPKLEQILQIVQLVGQVRHGVEGC